MYSISKQIDSYRIAYNRDNPQAPSRMLAYIHLSDKDNNRIGTLRLVDQSLPENIINQDGTFDIFYHIDRFNDIINILRYEKPLWVSIDTQFKSGQIQAVREPVGEEEL